MPEDDKLPATIGRYEVKGLLGAGAMGSVYLAEDPRIKRKIAIKMVKTDMLRNEADHRECFARFQREAEVSGLLNHPGIVAIYDFGESEAGTYLAMEYVEGRPLDAIMKSQDPIPLRERVRILAGVAEALDHAHSKGIVHRDVKPGNVMLSKEGRPKLMDFGIAKLEDGGLTQAGTFLGTPSYASPEQIKDGTVNARSDIFSFGVLAFELMSGKSPFPGNSINTILYRIVNEPPVFPEPPVPGVLPEGWRKTFEKVLAKRPEDRFPSCAAFMRDLLEAVTELDPDTRRQMIRTQDALISVEGALPDYDSTAVLPHETLKRLRGGHHRGRWVIAASAALVLAAGGAFLFFSKAGSPQRWVRCTPAATVVVNGQPKGQTPLSLPLKAGDKVELKAPGYKTFTRDLGEKDALPDVQLDPVVGPVTVRSEPTGAEVVVDGRSRGTTPLVFTWDQSRTVHLTLSKDGLAFSRDYAPGELPEATLKLQGGVGGGAEPTGPGTVRVTGGFSVRVREDGKDLGEWAPGRSQELPAGTHTLEVSNPRYFFKETRRVTVVAGKSASLGLPGLVTVTVESFPAYGKVMVDGLPTGIEGSGGERVQMAAGSHVFSLQGRPFRHSAQVQSDGQLVRFGPIPLQ